MRVELVRAVGLEPTRHKHTPLKRACLPIPACSRFNIDYCITMSDVCQQKFLKKLKKFFFLKTGLHNVLCRGFYFMVKRLYSGKGAFMA